MQFFKANTIAEATRIAQGLVHAAKLLGQTLSHCQALAIVAKENGYSSWADFRNSEEKRVNALLLDSELVSVRSTASNGYGEEELIYGKNGFCLRYSIDDNGELEHARVTDPLGREVVYYSDSEFEEAPREVVGALLRFMSRFTVTSKEVAATSDETGAVVDATKQPGALPAKLIELSAVLVDFELYDVTSGLSAEEFNNADLTDFVLCLVLNDDGHEKQLNLTKEEILDLKLIKDSDNKDVYLGADRTVYQFFTLQPTLISAA